MSRAGDRSFCKRESVLDQVLEKSTAASASTLGADIQREQVAMLYHAGRTAMVGIPSTAIVASIVFWSLLDVLLLVAWSSAILILTGIRGVLLYTYHRDPARQERYRIWSRRYLWLEAAIGMTYGIAAAIVPSQEPLYQFFILTLLTGTVAGALPIIGMIRHIYLTFIAPIIFCSAIAVLIQPDAVHTVLGVLVLIFGGIMVMADHNYVESLLGQLQARFENQRLMNELSSSNKTLAREIDARKKFEASLKVSTEKYQSLALFNRKLLESLPVGIIHLDDRMQVSYMNPCMVDLLGMDSMPSADSPPNISELAPLMVLGMRNVLVKLYNREPFSQAIHIRNKKGYELDLDMLGVPVATDSEGSGAVIIAVDVSHRAMLEMRLRQSANQAQEANVAKTAFLANMSHEFRTPLNAIIGYTELMFDTLEDMGPEDIKDDLNRVKTAGVHLLSLINEVLDYSKIESGKMELFLENIVIPRLLNDVSTTTEPMVSVKHNRLIVEYEEDIGNMVADDVKVKQILLNLVSNAAKSTAEGQIGLSVERVQQAGRDMIHFQVSDTGIGIAQDKLEKIFDAFDQADTSTTRKFGGTGLGLAICRSYAKLMGGNIWVESRPGEGSTFHVSIPAEVQVVDSGH